MEKSKTCDTCVSRFICPLLRPCDGWNDEGVFWGLLMMMLPSSEHIIPIARKNIQKLQKEARNERSDC